MSTYSKYHKKYYERKIRPFRKKKSEYAAYGKYRCPLCSTHRFMRDFDNAPYSFDAMKIAFTGRAGIKIQKNTTQYNALIHEILRKKVVELVHFYNMTPEELKIAPEVVLIRTSSSGRENSQKRIISPIIQNSSERIGGIK